MNSKIITWEIITTRFDPSEVELTIVVLPDPPGRDYLLQGRLHGPRCPYADTIQIAYPLRPMPSEDVYLRAKAIIPEPSLWEPATPFLYDVELQLIESGKLRDSLKSSHGIREFSLQKRGLRLNGRRFHFLGIRQSSYSEEESRILHNKGCNLVLSRTRIGHTELWDIADQNGLFILGWLPAEDEDLVWFIEQSLMNRPSVAGWVFPQTVLESRQLWHSRVSLLGRKGNQQPIGIHLEEHTVLPGEVAFVICDESMLEELQGTAVPKIVMTRQPFGEDSQIEKSPDILGWIYQEFESV